MRGLGSLQPAAALLLILAVLLAQHPQAAADGGALDEGTIMRRLRQAANDAGGPRRVCLFDCRLRESAPYRMPQCFAGCSRRVEQHLTDAPSSPAGLVKQQTEGWVGWSAESPADHHCTWWGVTCDARRHVTQM